MMLFWSAAAIGVVALLTATAYLVAINWSEEMYPRLLSGIGVGAITLLVTTLSTLKGTHEETKFVVAVLFDESTHKPIVLLPDPKHGGTIAAVSLNTSLASLAAQVDPPGTGADDIAFYGEELLQHHLLTDICEIQRLGTSVGTVLGSPRVEIGSPTQRVSLPDRIEIQPSAFLNYHSNRFAKTQSAVFGWKIAEGLRAPKGTRVQLEQRRGPPSRHLIRASKDGYFTLEIAIEAIGGASIGQPPEGTFAVPEGRQLSTSLYDVTVTTDFEKLTAGNWRTAVYKRWASWLTTELVARNTVRK